MPAPTLSRAVALTIASSLRYARTELMKQYQSCRDPKTQVAILQELQSYDIALLWIASQTPR